MVLTTFLKPVDILQFWLKSDTINRYYVHGDLHAFVLACEALPAKYLSE